MTATPKPEIRLVLEYLDGTSRTVADLYPARCWPGRPGAVDGRYRLKVDRVWHRPGGVKYVFLTLDEAWAALTRLDAAPEASAPPDIAPGDLVRVTPPGRGTTLTRVRSLPFQGPDGRWRVFVSLFDEPFLVDELKQEAMRYVAANPENCVDPCDDPDSRVDGRPRRPGPKPHGHGAARA